MYKDKAKQREAVKRAVDKHRGITSQGITDKGITPLGNLPERPRYLTLSDGQVLDRANPPKGKVNEYDLNGYKALTQEGNEKEYGLILSLADPIRRKKIQSITDSLKKHSMLDGVRYGLWGHSFKSIDNLLKG